MSLFPFSGLRDQLQQTTHGFFAVAAAYLAPGVVKTSTPVNVRLWTKTTENTEPGGYGKLLSPVDQICFNAAELTDAGITPVRGGKVIFADGYPGMVQSGALTKTLEAQDLTFSGSEIVWNCA